MKTIYEIKNKANGAVMFQSGIESRARLMCNHETEFVTSKEVQE